LVLMKLPVYSSTIRRKEMDAVLTCMVSEKIGPGEMNQKLTQLAREYFGVDTACAFRSPAIALHYILTALDLAPGSGIILSALAPRWQYLTVVRSGFKPIVIDVDPDSALVTPDAVLQAVQGGGRLLVLHTTSGMLPDYEAFSSFGIPIVEDVSQAAGAVSSERKAGTFGVYSIVGLEERDILTGGGGALLLAPNRREGIVLKRLVDVGPSTDILPDINSSLAWVQLKELDKNSLVRREMHNLYVRSLMQGRHKTFVQSGVEQNTSAVYYFPVILSSGLKEVRQYTGRKEIEIELAFADSIVAMDDFPEEGCVQARSLILRCVFFPLYPRLGTAAAKVAKVLATLP